MPVRAMLATLLLATAPTLAQSAAPALEPDARISAILAEALANGEAPGGVAAIVRYGEPDSIGAFGVRKLHDDTPFAVDDPVHIGSNTKAMNAALVARLVDRGVMKFETTIAEAMPKLAEELHEDYHDVTVLQLLRHSSGAPANAKNWRAFQDLELGERRRRIVAANLASAPSHEPGTKFVYSNLGSMVASVMCETVTGESWEDLMRAEIFAPLGMTSAGFGAPGTKGEVDAPWGHGSFFGKASKDAPPVALQRDNDEAMAGAGILHMNLSDHGKFVLAFSKAVGDDDSFLKPATRAKLLEPGPFRYACGWGVAERGWSKGKVISHAGSNTMWYEIAWIAPEEGVGYLVGVNCAPEGIGSILDGVVAQLIRMEAKRRANGD